MSEFLVSSLSELQKLAKTFVTQHENGAIVLLQGEVGAGKTTFVRNCVEVLYPNHNFRVISPTYVIRQQYGTAKLVEHFDLYRFENLDQKALWEMGYSEAVELVKKTKGFLFVEWPEKILNLSFLEANIKIQFENLGENLRKILIFNLQE